MQEPLSAYSESHQKLVRALSSLAGNQQSYSRQELVRLVRRKYPELNKNDIKPQKHCLNYEATSACECSQTAQALFEKLETPDGSTRYRVLATESNTGPLNRPANSKSQNASAFARAPVMANRRAEPVIETPEPPKDVLKKILEQAPETPSALSKPHPAEAPKGLRAWQKLGLEISQQIAQGLKQRLFGPKESLESIEQDLKQNFKITLPTQDAHQSAAQSTGQPVKKPAAKSRFSLPPLPALPALPMAKSTEPAESESKPANKPARAILQVLRLPAPDGIQRLMVQHLSLADKKKQHLKLAPLEEGVSFELVHLHFQDKVVKELSVTGSEPIEIGFRLIGAETGSSGLQIHGLNDGVWRLLHTTEQSFPVCLESQPEIQTEIQTEIKTEIKTEIQTEAQAETKSESKSEPEAKVDKSETTEQPDKPAVSDEPETKSESPDEQAPASQIGDQEDKNPEQSSETEKTIEPVAETLVEAKPVKTDTESSPISAVAAQPEEKPEPVIEKAEPVNPLAWLEPIPEHYQPLLLHLQTHSSLTEAAMISLLGGGNGGARKARGFANQVDQWQLPFEIEIISTDEGKSYRKV